MTAAASDARLRISPPEVPFREGRWFHPAVAVDARGDWIMTLQRELGCDYYSPPHVCVSPDRGRSWSAPEPIPALATRPAADGLLEAIADVRPFFHPPSRSIIAIGCNTYYTDGGLADHGSRVADPRYPRRTVYAVRDACGRWGPRRELAAADGPLNAIAACTQLVIFPDGDALVPFYFNENPETRGFHCGVSTVRCRFLDGELRVERRGETLRHPPLRGLLEPSAALFRNRLYLTLRAEDGYGYWCVGDDGLSWGPRRPWSWDDGEALAMSTTQQHWLELDGELYLAYTRRNGENGAVPRFRAPLYLCRFDTALGALARAEEREVMPLAYRGRTPGLLGNFHTAPTGGSEAVITDAPLWASCATPPGPPDTEVWLARVTAGASGGGCEKSAG